mmetsp:Transcript_24593/g.40485  ORF Transcript_24593/g.40485 Transcript_24593/m.40485 type:complete len:308 (+) Transcript_24593:595-1518(+)
MLARQTSLIALAIDSNVLQMLVLELLHRFLDNGPTPRLAHGVCAEVGVAPCSIPIALYWLGVKRNDDGEFFTDALHQVSRKPQLVTSLNTYRGAHLELPLARHDLGVNTRDVNASIQARTVMRLYQLTPKHFVITCTAIVRSLRTRETVLGPAQRPLGLGKEGVLLLQAKPRQLIFHLLHHLSSMITGVGGNGVTSRSIAICKNKDIVASSERIFEDCLWFQNNFGVISWGLPRARAIEVPQRKFGRRGNSFIEGLSFAPDVFPRSVNPDVLGLNLPVLRQREILFNDCLLNRPDRHTHAAIDGKYP